MTETAKLGLPLVQPSQAQKHVTVNEAFTRLDSLTQVSVLSRSVTVPPADAAEGVCYLVPTGASAAWNSHVGEIAIRSNNGWVFVPMVEGWRIWVADEGQALDWVAGEFVSGLIARSASGAATQIKIWEYDQTLASGSVVDGAEEVPGTVLVFGITGRVLTALSGSLSDWQLGHGSSADRYGSGLGLGSGSWLRGLTGQPQAYYSGFRPKFTANGGDFAGGSVRVAIHYMELGLPSAS
ncbi:DUF2793 domain-containing protein [Cognatishimia sp. MH4019]|uniref:DUF2793 domain-containing protein n=1 Tax=Cognatishimia sp. MH4019 TaxID=2854030 RepID=UPI001CD1F8D8|nr:DUF2793 domain-containing protein [Cognatishimia sp. MH4019]